MENQFEEIFRQIKSDVQNIDYTNAGIDPLYYASKEAKILIIGQAPGKKAQDTRIVWNDPSGQRLRKWMGVSDEEFYHSKKIAIMPMDFYFPGKGKSGDLPPRKKFAAKWHPRLLELMPQVELIILVGSYAVREYLNLKTKDKLTDVVKNYQEYLPRYFPLVHPSPRNQIWLKKNPWFEKDVVPKLQSEVKRLMK
ncbi:Uracil DNA glycosylase superfamily protein [Ligilactobacillus hayakitensis DSM 18933 = JCM 14209]|uniref:Uracil DNA glycosylase superfamily protein n=1 Tax=Ligilactobacillus hayakitensis DSM 18933 = JCM 14209 TaxID=1423755 RepID=A0A0R1WV30_9LACO|nr:uracil-DNA glycosylase family protein [Ligilactobacillus hayakitensis]KRM19579.1 Uracil DNA glycosylase superfamily protein [Ligilactobacillus hayakitensis DSM 18933 = JCM 14209]